MNQKIPQPPGKYAIYVLVFRKYHSAKPLFKPPLCHYYFVHLPVELAYLWPSDLINLVLLEYLETLQAIHAFLARQRLFNASLASRTKRRSLHVTGLTGLLGVS